MDEPISDTTVMRIHDMSMSKNERVACTGRLLKHIHRDFRLWFGDCIQRGDGPELAIQSAAAVFASELSAMIEMGTKKEKRDEVVLMVVNTMYNLLQDKERGIFQDELAGHESNRGRNTHAVEGGGI